MSRELTFEQLATTEDTGELVLRAEFPDVGSMCDVILVEGDALHVWLVESNVKGDMKRMIDEIVRQTGRQEVVFLSPLDFSNIRERVYDYEEVTETLPNGKKQKRLVTTWELDDDTTES